jgi:hypothetical protein
MDKTPNVVGSMPMQMREVGMIDTDARRAIQQQQASINKLSQAIGQVATATAQKELAAQQEKIKNTMIEAQSKIYDKATAYTNLIMIGGFAGAFATWSATRAQLPVKANVTVALLLGFSLLSFILFEIYKMTYTSIKFMKTRSLLVTQAPPDQFIANLQKLALEEQTLASHFIPIWIATMVISLGAGLAALALLFYNYFSILMDWSM